MLIKQYLDITLIGFGASTNEIFLYKILEPSWTLIYLGKRGYKGISLQHAANLCGSERISTPKGSSVPLPAPLEPNVGEKTFSHHSLPIGARFYLADFL